MINLLKKAKKIIKKAIKREPIFKVKTTGGAQSPFGKLLELSSFKDTAEKIYNKFGVKLAAINCNVSNNFAPGYRLTFQFGNNSQGYYANTVSFYIQRTIGNCGMALVSNISVPNNKDNKEWYKFATELIWNTMHCVSMNQMWAAMYSTTDNQLHNSLKKAGWEEFPKAWANKDPRHHGTYNVRALIYSKSFKK